VRPSGRIPFALSCAGHYPRCISITNKNHSPDVALVLGGLTGQGCTLLQKLAGKRAEEVGGTPVNMAALRAVITYAMVMSSYIKRKHSRTDLPPS
jgi:ethanolamine permease